MELFASHCVFPTPDICGTADFYCEKLGFGRVDFVKDQQGFAGRI